MNPDVESIRRRKSGYMLFAVIWGLLSLFLLFALLFATMLEVDSAGGQTPEMSWMLVAVVLGIVGALTGLIRCLIVAGRLESQLPSPSETR